MLREEVRISVHDAFAIVDATFTLQGPSTPERLTVAFPGAGVPLSEGLATDMGWKAHRPLAGFEAWVDGKPMRTSQVREHGGTWHTFEAQFGRTPSQVRVRYGVLSDLAHPGRFTPGEVPQDGPDATVWYILATGARWKGRIQEAKVIITPAGGVRLEHLSVRDGHMAPVKYSGDAQALVHVKPFTPPYGQRLADRIELVRRDFEPTQKDNLEIVFTPNWARRMGKAPPPWDSNHVVAQDERAMMNGLFADRAVTALPSGIVKGRVVDEAGRPVADAYIGLLTRQASESMGNYPRQLSAHNAALSNAEGVFYVPWQADAVASNTNSAFQVAWQANALLRVEHSAFVTLQRPYGGESPIEVRVSRGFAVSGRAMKGDGSPAAGQRIVCLGADLTRDAETDSNGRFTVSGLPVGRYRVAVGDKELRRPSFDAVAVEVPTQGDVLLHQRVNGVSVQVSFGGRFVNRSSLLRGRQRPKTRAELESAFAGSIDTSVIAANLALFEHVPPGEYTVLLEEIGMRSVSGTKFQTNRALLLPITVGMEPVNTVVPLEAVMTAVAD
jgi:hypothetical protein